MRISVEMSLYPLQTEYVSEILGFLEELNKVEGLSVKTNTMSTQVFGEYDLVMSSIARCLKVPFESGVPMSLVTKILNLDREHSVLNE
ncbi:MAG: hypothetical protein HOL48_01310 [Porticoccaceae bacterium]|jgi:uncharacterized protein YqgV (UPF0045/DUF77 family)|nr:hypothetical protein [Porticoccaceae bacterium]